MKSRTLYSILGVLGVGTVVASQTPMENELKQAETLIGMRAIGNAINAYAADYDGIYPYPQDMNGLKYVTQKYVEEKGFWANPNPKKSEFRFNMSLAGVAKADVKEPEKTVLLYESNQWPNRLRAVSFVDGSARMLKPVEWGLTARSLATRLERKAQPLPESYGKLWKE